MSESTLGIFIAKCVLGEKYGGEGSYKPPKSKRKKTDSSKL